LNYLSKRAKKIGIISEESLNKLIEYTTQVASAIEILEFLETEKLYTSLSYHSPYLPTLVIKENLDTFKIFTRLFTKIPAHEIKWTIDLLITSPSISKLKQMAMLEILLHLHQFSAEEIDTFALKSITNNNPDIPLLKPQTWWIVLKH
jgi:hypothetical protein